MNEKSIFFIIARDCRNFFTVLIEKCIFISYNVIKNICEVALCLNDLK